MHLSRSLAHRRTMDGVGARASNRRRKATSAASASSSSSSSSSSGGAHKPARQAVGVSNEDCVGALRAIKGQMREMVQRLDKDNEETDRARIQAEVSVAEQRQKLDRLVTEDLEARAAFQHSRECQQYLTKVMSARALIARNHPHHSHLRNDPKAGASSAAPVSSGSGKNGKAPPNEPKNELPDERPTERPSMKHRNEHLYKFFPPPLARHGHCTFQLQAIVMGVYLSGVRGDRMTGRGPKNRTNSSNSQQAQRNCKDADTGSTKQTLTPADERSKDRVRKLRPLGGRARVVSAAAADPRMQQLSALSSLSSQLGIDEPGLGERGSLSARAGSGSRNSNGSGGGSRESHRIVEEGELCTELHEQLLEMSEEELVAVYSGYYDEVHLALWAQLHSTDTVRSHCQRSLEQVLNEREDRIERRNHISELIRHLRTGASAVSLVPQSVSLSAHTTPDTSHSPITETNSTTSSSSSVSSLFSPVAFSSSWMAEWEGFASRGGQFCEREIRDAKALLRQLNEVKEQRNELWKHARPEERLEWAKQWAEENSLTLD